MPVPTQHIAGLKRLTLWFRVKSEQRLEGIAFAMFANRLRQCSRPVQVHKANFLQVVQKDGIANTSKETAMQVQPLLNFDGRCEEALDHYTEALGAKVTGKMRWKDCPDKTSHATPGNEEKILNASFGIGKTTFMAMDGPDPSGKPEFKGITLSMVVADTAEAKRLFEAIRAGGKVMIPLAKTFYSSLAGMAADRFGVSWMVIVEA